ELWISARALVLGSSEDLEKQLGVYRQRVHDIYLDLFAHRKETGDFPARELFRILNQELSEADAASYFETQGFRDGRSALAAVLSLNGSEIGGQSAPAARNVLANLLAVLMPRLLACARPE